MNKTAIPVRLGRNIYVAATGDTTPILYLAQKYCIEDEQRQRAALSALAGLAPQLAALLKAAGVAP